MIDPGSSWPAAFLDVVGEGEADGDGDEDALGVPVEGESWDAGVVRLGGAVLTPAMPQKEVENWMDVKTSS